MAEPRRIEQIKDSATRAAGRAGYSFVASGGSVGAAANKAVQSATEDVSNKAAERLARRARFRQIQQRRQNRAAQIQAQAQPKKKEKKMTGFGFGMVVAAAILKDTLDVLLHFTVVLSPLIIFMNLLLAFIITFYLFYNLVKPSVRKVAVMSIAILVEFIPILSMVMPAATISLFLIRYLENGGKFSGAITKVVPTGRLANVIR